MRDSHEIEDWMMGSGRTGPAGGPVDTGAPGRFAKGEGSEGSGPDHEIVRTTGDDTESLDPPTMEFSVNGHAVRAVIQNGRPWFVAVDGDAMQRSPSRVTLSWLDDEKGPNSVRTLGGKQAASVVNETGVYRLIFRSRKPHAEAFRRWATHAVLPSIGQTGRYETEPTQALQPGAAGREIHVSSPGDTGEGLR